MCALLIGSSYVTRSQTTDTLCFPVPVIQKVLIDAKQKKLVDSLNVLLRSDINILTGKINLLEEKDRNHLAIEKAYEGQVTVLNREVRRWRRKTTWTAVGGLVLTGLTAFLILK
jgi:hypothetical protein